MTSVAALTPEEYAAAVPGLAALIVDAVDAGSGVHFMAGVTLDEAADWWLERLPRVVDGTDTVFVARSDGGPVVGSTLLMRSMNPNSLHRAEVGKVIVHRSVRRQGLGRALMLAAEDRARADGRWLLMLDTVTDSAADAMYRALGWQPLGVVPGHARFPDGRLSDTTFFWKDLRAG